MRKRGRGSPLLASAALLGGIAALMGSCAGNDSPATPATEAPDRDAQAGADAVAEAPASDGSDGSPSLAPCETTLIGPTRGGPIARSQDGQILVVVERDYEGSVTIFRWNAAPVRLRVDGEPYQVVMDACGDRAWVIQRKFQQVEELVGLRDPEPRVNRHTFVGSEPTGLAVTPNHSFLYVANWVEGTLSVVDLRDSNMPRIANVDLNAALLKTGWLGNVQRVPGLAHPRSVAITNDGDSDDLDETVYVTEFFSQRISPHGASGVNELDGTTADTNRKGFVYAVRVADGSVTTIPLSALKNTGFVNAAGVEAGCFPNQLQSITIEGNFAYVTSICASPFGSVAMYTAGRCSTDADCERPQTCKLPMRSCSGTCATDADCGVGAHQGACRLDLGGACEPIASNVKSSTFPVVHVIDTRENVEVPAARVNLNHFFRDLYDSRGVADDATRRFPLVANEIAFVPDGSGTAFVTANGADALFRLQFDHETGVLTSVGGPEGTPNFLDLSVGVGAYGDSEDRGPIGPIGVTLSADGRGAYVANDISRTVTVVDTAQMSDAAYAGFGPNEIRAAPLPDSIALLALRGRGLFNSGLGRWSYRGQAWVACQSCHFEGLSDNVTWYLARGPRQAVSLDGSFASGEPHDQRIFNWTGVFDEITDFEVIIRQLQGGQGVIVDSDLKPVNLATAAGGPSGLDGSSAGLSALDDWDAVMTWLQTIRSPRGPRDVVPDEVTKGRDLFVQAGCGGCHGGPKWTLSHRFYPPDRPTTGDSVTTRLFTTAYDGAALVAAGFPAALLPAPSGSQFMRSPAPSDPKFLDLDQIQCVLRPVGTYGVSPPEVGVAEKRGDMLTAAQGNEDIGKGYNVPSLLGLSVGAPYFHAGNARTLEELLLHEVFVTHRNALAQDTMLLADPANVKALIAFLLSIDELTPIVALPSVPGASGGDFCQAPP